MDRLCDELRKVVVELEESDNAGMIAPLLSEALKRAVPDEYRRFITVTTGDTSSGKAADDSPWPNCHR